MSLFLVEAIDAELFLVKIVNSEFVVGYEMILLLRIGIFSVNADKRIGVTVKEQYLVNRIVCSKH